MVRRWSGSIPLLVALLPLASSVRPPLLHASSFRPPLLHASSFRPPLLHASSDRLPLDRESASINVRTRRSLVRSAVVLAGSTGLFELHGSSQRYALAAEVPESALETMAVLDLLRIYGRLAGNECFGRSVPAASGASCQLSLDSAARLLGLVGPGSRGGMSVSEGEFAAVLATRPFRWPLKPWGTARSASNAKTAMMNKSAETALFMAELEKRGLYDRRNPAGPLPTSLRPALDAQIDAEPIDPVAVRIAFRALGARAGRLTADGLADTFRAAAGGASEDGEGDAQALDYYSFQALVGQAARVVWPPPSE